MSNSGKKISPSLEDYLEAIYNLRRLNSSVRVTDIAIELGIAKPSVNNAISLLKDKGFVNQERYGLVELTQAGERRAEYILTKHTNIKSFLIKVLGVDEVTAEVEACKIEHIISDDTVFKMKLLINKLEER
ncbi:MAG TPA: metal-dependent transcriptional regulator [Clostridiales bacterium]|jgi:Mn-dependent DtxR family transcriptional regulator|nr:metal-dependent transcriptional regulator [Clostridiales bacterium]